MLFFANRFLSLKLSKTQSHHIKQHFCTRCLKSAPGKKNTLPAPLEQVTIWLVVIDNGKFMRPAVCSIEERGLISRTAAGNWAYASFNSQEW